MKEQMNKIDQAPNSSKELLVVGGIILVLALGGFTWYYIAKKKKEQNTLEEDKQDTDVFTTPPFMPVSNPTTSTTSSPTSSSSSSSSSSSTYRIKMGSRHPDVKILQRYLKYYKQPLGRSGPKRDGVDGIFGKLTAKGAQKKLGKTSFTRSDIQSMKNTLKLLGQ